MSLDTLLQIGEVFRKSKTGLKHHRYVKQPPQRDGKNAKAVGNSIRYFVVPAQADGSFDFAQHRVLEEEEKGLAAIRHLFYLNFKTSEADTYKKFIFGDVFRLLDEKTKKDSGGNFVLGDPAKNGLYALNSFRRGELEMPAIQDATIANFRASFTKQWQQIEAVLLENPQVFIHFDFAGKSWWQLEAPMRVLNEKLLSDIVAKREDGSYVLQKFLYKALAMDSGRIPGLSTQHAHKCRLFNSVDEVMNLVYVLDFSTKPIIRKGDVKIIVLPRGENLTAPVIESFFERRSLGSEEIEKAEDTLTQKNKQETLATIPADEQGPDDDMEEEENFAPFVQNVHSSIVAYDFIFSKAGGVSSPDVDMIEVPGLQRSLLNELSKRVRQAKQRVLKERAGALPHVKKLMPISITQSFLNLLGDATTAKKKYQSHLFKTLPQIYTGTYVNDPILLPALIEKTEFNIRNDKANYVFLRWDFIFLQRIQNYSGDRMKELTDSPSYRVGLALGKLARHFSGPNSPIKSFEKNYVGLLSRRISNLSDVMQLGNDINQKIIMHRDNVYFSPKEAQEFSDAVKAMQTSGARYDKNECAFGFFESYYASRAKTEEPKETEVTAA